MRVRTLSVAVALAGLFLAGSPARACDSNYPWLCKPIPSTGTAEAPAEAKPVVSRRAAAVERRAQVRAARTTARAARAMARAERAAKAKEKHAAGKTNARRLVLRERQTKVAEAREVEEEVSEIRSSKAKIASPPLPRPNAVRLAQAAAEPNVGFAALWGERSTGTSEPVETPVKVVSEPVAAAAPAAPLSVAAASEVNELDLAAAKIAPQLDGGWLRNLFIAFGGLLAVGSALRLFI